MELLVSTTKRTLPPGARMAALAAGSPPRAAHTGRSDKARGRAPPAALAPAARRVARRHRRRARRQRQRGEQRRQRGGAAAEVYLSPRKAQRGLICYYANLKKGYNLFASFVYFMNMN